MTRRRQGRWFLVGAVTFAACWAVWAVPRIRGARDRGAALDFGEGRVLEVLATTYGKTHAYLKGRWPGLDGIRRRAGWLQGVLGEPTRRVTTSSAWDDLCVFHGPRGEGNPFGRESPWLVASFDRHGCRLAVDSGRGTFWMDKRPIGHQCLGNYPRREARFEVEFGLATGDAAPVMRRWWISNPSPWTGLEWVPEALPAVREVGEARISFLGFAGDRRWLGPRFRVEVDGRERMDWVARELLFRDVTGNSAYAPALCRHEAAWKIDAGFARSPEAVSESNQVWEVAGIEVPEGGGLLELTETATLEGVTVQPLLLGGGGVFELKQSGAGTLQVLTAEPPSDPGGGGGDSVSSSGSGSGSTEYRIAREGPWLAVSLKGLRSDHAWNVALVEENGTGHWNRGWSGMGPGSRLVNFPRIPAGTMVRLRFVVQTLRRVEFLVKPPSPDGGAPDRIGQHRSTGDVA